MEDESPKSKRWAKVAALVVVLIGVVAIAGMWHAAGMSLTPGPAAVELTLETDGEALLDGRSLGTGTFVLDDATLRSAGMVVPAGSSITEIVSLLFPREEFCGPWTTRSDAAVMNPEGVQCYLRGREQRVVRIWVFELDDYDWLAVPMQFRDSKGRVHTEIETTGVFTNSSRMKKYNIRHMSAEVLMVDGTFPE
jgi:hypothetical protein